MTTISQSTLKDLVEYLVTHFVTDNLETIMRAEIQTYLEENQDGRGSSRNATTNERSIQNTATTISVRMKISGAPSAHTG